MVMSDPNTNAIEEIEDVEDFDGEEVDVEPYEGAPDGRIKRNETEQDDIVEETEDA